MQLFKKKETPKEAATRAKRETRREVRVRLRKLNSIIPTHGTFFIFRATNEILIEKFVNWNVKKSK